jgi:hypothetical protein
MRDSHTAPCEVCRTVGGLCSRAILAPATLSENLTSVLYDSVAELRSLLGGCCGIHNGTFEYDVYREVKVILRDNTSSYVQ